MKSRGGLADSPFFAPPPASNRVADVQTTLVRHEERSTPMFPQQQERQKEILQESKIARNLTQTVQSALEMKSTTNTSFRYPQELLDRLEEVTFTIRKRYKKRVTKNAILIAALASCLFEFDEEGENSVLFKELVKE
jgi:hypothetical protein